ncbi:MAG: dihydroneopterin aldolase family protein [Candidatus Bathyarchaeia archaeon]|nr:dihydroneopterin aldolase family protein [Candidatus Bathyarchaeota archaeon]
MSITPIVGLRRIYGMGDVELEANRYFAKDLTDRERAIFEGAVTLGALYHQFIGAPVSRDPRVIEALESCMEACMALQPYKEKVEVRIRRDMVRGEKKHPFDYETLRGKHLDVRVTSKFGAARAVLRMRYIPEIDYTLMYVESIAEDTSK